MMRLLIPFLFALLLCGLTSAQDKTPPRPAGPGPAAAPAKPKSGATLRFLEVKGKDGSVSYSLDFTDLSKGMASAVKEFLKAHPGYSVLGNSTIMPGCWGDYDRNGATDFALIFVATGTFRVNEHGVAQSDKMVAVFNGAKNGKYTPYIAHRDNAEVFYLKTETYDGATCIHYESHSTIIAKFLFWDKDHYSDVDVD